MKYSIKNEKQTNQTYFTSSSVVICSARLFSLFVACVFAELFRVRSKDFLAYRSLRKDQHLFNIIYHANKQDKRNFNRFLNKVVPGEAVRSLHTPSQNAQMGGDDKSSGANALSETTDTIMPQFHNNDKQNLKSANLHFSKILIRITT